MRKHIFTYFWAVWNSHVLCGFLNIFCRQEIAILVVATLGRVTICGTSRSTGNIIPSVSVRFGAFVSIRVLGSCAVPGSASALSTARAPLVRSGSLLAAARNLRVAPRYARDCRTHVLFGSRDIDLFK